MPITDPTPLLRLTQADLSFLLDAAALDARRSQERAMIAAWNATPGVVVEIEEWRR